MKTIAHDLSSRTKGLKDLRSYGWMVYQSVESNLVPSAFREFQLFACADRLDQNRALSVC